MVSIGLRVYALSLMLSRQGSQTLQLTVYPINISSKESYRNIEYGDRQAKEEITVTSITYYTWNEMFILYTVNIPYLM
jgi:hypothetical protein